MSAASLPALGRRRLFGLPIGLGLLGVAPQAELAGRIKPFSVGHVFNVAPVDVPMPIVEAAPHVVRIVIDDQASPALAAVRATLEQLQRELDREADARRFAEWVGG